MMTISLEHQVTMDRLLPRSPPFTRRAVRMISPTTVDPFPTDRAGKTAFGCCVRHDYERDPDCLWMLAAADWAITYLGFLPVHDHNHHDPAHERWEDILDNTWFCDFRTEADATLFQLRWTGFLE